MSTPSTQPLPTSYLLFPRGNGRAPWLMPMTDHEAKTALDRMKYVDSLRAKDASTLEVAFQGCRFSFPWMGGVHHALTELEASAGLGWHAHPDVARFFRPPAVHPGVLLRVQSGMLYPEEFGCGAVEASWLNLMYCRLATAPLHSVPGVFRELAAAAGFAAVEVLEDGLVLFGNPNPVRDVKALLKRTDLIPLLEDHDQEVRERAIAILGTLC
jgi:hypothetical protein